MFKTAPRSVARLAALTLVALLGWWAPPLAAQTLQTKQVMRQKLAQSQQLLAALVTSNWASLSSRSRELEALTNQPGWAVLRLPEFNKQTMAFQRAIQTLAEAAKQRDQRTALTAYNGLVASCVECHSFVARSRIAIKK
jgi:Cytochrome C'